MSEPEALPKVTEHGMYRLDGEGPVETRASVQFSNWTEPGMLISAAKARLDAAHFRECHRVMSQNTTDERARSLASWLETLAGQFEKAALGHRPQAE